MWVARSACRGGEAAQPCGPGSAVRDSGARGKASGRRPDEGGHQQGNVMRNTVTKPFGSRPGEKGTRTRRAGPPSGNPEEPRSYGFDVKQGNADPKHKAVRLEAGGRGLGPASGPGLRTFTKNGCGGKLFGISAGGWYFHTL